MPLTHFQRAEHIRVDGKEISLIPTLRSENLADISTERLKHSAKMSARFSDLKVGIGELSFPVMQEPLRNNHFKIRIELCSNFPSVGPWDEAVHKHSLIPRCGRGLG